MMKKGVGDHLWRVFRGEETSRVASLLPAHIGIGSAHKSTPHVSICLQVEGDWAVWFFFFAGKTKYGLIAVCREQNKDGNSNLGPIRSFFFI